MNRTVSMYRNLQQWKELEKTHPRIHKYAQNVAKHYQEKKN